MKTSGAVMVAAEPRRMFFGGDLDPTFAADGIADLAYGAAGLAVQADGKPLIASVGASAISVYRLTAAGVPDTAFGTNGQATLSFVDGTYRPDVTITDMAVGPDGKIVVVGHTRNDPSPVGLVGRFNANGTPDTTFADNGRLVVDGIDLDYGNTSFHAVKVQPNNRIVIAGWGEIDYGNAPERAVFVRLNVNGTFDNSFGGNGQLTSEIDAIPSSLSLAPNGQILFGGTSYDGSTADTQFTYGRINSDGTFDSNFDGDGVHTTPFLLAYERNSLLDIQALPDNKILIVGAVGHRDEASLNVGVLRLNVNGTRDTTFGSNNGRAELEFDTPGVADFGREIEISSTGKYLIGGGGPGEMKVAMLNTDGTRDGGFAGDGTLNLPSAGSGLSRMLVAPGGKVLAVNRTASTEVVRFEDRRSLAVGMFTLSSVMREQGQTTVGVAVTRDRALPTPTTVYLDLAGTAVYPIEGVVNRPIDYTASGITLPGEFVPKAFITIPAGESSTVFTLTAVDDTRIEGTETAIVSIADVGAYDAFAPRSLTLTIEDNDLPAPVVTARSFDHLTLPHRASFTFDQDVGSSLTASDFTATGPGTVPARTLTYDPATRTGRLTFGAGALPDGDYTLTLPANRVTNATGQPNASSSTLNFFVLAGDANRDRTVNFSDLLVLAQNYGVSSRTFAQGDFNYDGTVNFNDLLILAQKYGTTLAGSASASATGGTPAVSPSAPLPGMRKEDDDEVASGATEVL